MDNRGRILGMIGLAARGRRLVSGEDMCERAIKSKKARLCIVSAEASDNTKKKFRNMCEYRNVKYIFWGEKEELGKYTGKDMRTVIVITEEGFVNKILNLLDISDTEV